MYGLWVFYRCYEFMFLTLQTRNGGTYQVENFTS